LNLRGFYADSVPLFEFQAVDSIGWGLVPYGSCVVFEENEPECKKALTGSPNWRTKRATELLMLFMCRDQSFPI
jgi:hypothetical protein